MYDWTRVDPAFNAWVLLRQAWESIDKSMQVELETHGTTLPQIDLLMILCATDRPLTQSELASFIFREKHSAHGLLKRMEKAGYVKRIRARDDRRVVEVHIQPKGRELVNKAVTSGFAYAYRIVRNALSTEEIIHLCDLLARLRNTALQELGVESVPLPEDIDARRVLGME